MERVLAGEEVRAAGRMELVADAATGRHHYHLNGRRLQEGDLIELALADGTWVAGVYSWSGNRARWPGMRIALAAPPSDGSSHDARRRSAVIALPPEHSIVRLATRW